MYVWCSYYYIYQPQNTHNIAQAFKNNNRGGCQRGTKAYQCWPPLQLNDTIQVHKYTKSIKKKKMKTQLIYKLTKVHVQKKIAD